MAGAALDNLLSSLAGGPMGAVPRRQGRTGESNVKVAYVFSTSGHTASYKLGKMILPQLEEGRHGAEVVGMFFFDDNTYVLRAGDPLGERLGKVARDQGMLLMLCDQCALERNLAEGEPGACRPSNTVEGVQVGCFPDLYAALATNPPDQVITL
jgi:sulfur relay (sulfurtransferase) complex TusBCD TusD component (DsrE family)